MKRRIVHLRVEPEPEDVLGSMAWEGPMVEPPNPLREMERAAAAAAAGNAAGALDAFSLYQRRLQQTATDEAHRLVGELVAEVELAAGLEAKVGRAIVHGGRLIQSRPPDHILQQFADPVAFVARCRALVAAVERYLATTLNHQLAALGLPELDNPGLIVREMAGELASSAQEVHTEGLDTKVMMVRQLMVLVGAPRR
ncbi:MAG: hypothetical protein ACYDAC_07385 [Candidatus Dormibacteria bacterium]